MTNNFSVLIVSGTSYLLAETVFNSVDHAKIVIEIENTLHVKFVHRYFMHGTCNKEKHKIHQSLSSLISSENQYIIELFEKRHVLPNFCVEEGLDVAIATKIIEYGCGINNENKAYNVVVISNEPSLSSALECVINRKLSTVTVIPTSKDNIPSELSKYVHKNVENNETLCLDNIIRRCLNVSTVNSPQITDFSVVSPPPLLSDEEVRAIEELSCDGIARTINNKSKTPSIVDVNATDVADMTSSDQQNANEDHVLRSCDPGLVEYINGSKSISDRDNKGNVSFSPSLSDNNPLGDSGLRPVRMKTHMMRSASNSHIVAITMSDLDKRVLRETTEYLRIQRAVQVPRNVFSHGDEQLGMMDVGLRVTGAGIASVNGEYRFAGLLNHGGCFEKSSLDEQLGRATRFTIYKCLINDLKHRCFVWFLSQTSGAMRPGGPQDINYYFSVADKPTDKAPSQPWFSMSNSTPSSLLDTPPTVTGCRMKSDFRGLLSRTAVGVKRMAGPVDAPARKSSRSASSKSATTTASLNGVRTDELTKQPSPEELVANWSSTLSSLFADMFPSAPVERVAEDLLLQTTRLAKHCGVSLERASAVGSAVCGSFKELHCQNRLQARKRGISLVCLEFVTNLDSKQSACCKLLLRVYPALLSPEVERSVTSTLSKLGEQHGVWDDDSITAVMTFCDVLARCADIRSPFASLSLPFPVLKDRVDTTALPTVLLPSPLTADTADTTPLFTGESSALTASDALPPPVKLRRDQLLEKLFVAQFQGLFPTLRISDVAPFSRVIDAVAKEWRIDDPLARTVCRAVYAVLSEMKTLDDKLTGERQSRDVQDVPKDFNNHARCVQQLMNVFRRLSETDVKAFVQRLTITIDLMVACMSGEVYRNSLSVLTKFCVLLTNWLQLSLVVV